MAYPYKTSRRRKAQSKSRSSFIGSSYARRLHVETLEDRRLLAVFSVSNLSDADPGSLRAAIGLANSAAGPDEIVFSGAATSGTIALTSGELVISDTLTITGSGPGAPGLTIDAQQSSRVLNFSSTSGDLNLEGLTVTGGLSANDGGGIRFYSSGALTLIGSTVSGNSTTGTFSRGGGISTESGSVSLTSSTVSDNSTTGGPASGGGIATQSGSVSLTSSTVSGNKTTGSNASGGGIFTQSGSVSLTSSTVSGNSTTGMVAPGGAIYTNGGSVSLTSSTASGNMAGGAGGGVFVFNSSANRSFTIVNSIVAGNTAGGTAPDLRPDFDSTLTINHSLIGNTSSGLTTTQLQAITNGSGNLQNIDPLLGPLADNVGPTQTRTLLVGSPALNVGDPSQTGFDQRGAPFLRNDGSGVDMGAYEQQTLASALFVVTTLLDELDYSNADVSLREAINSANGSVGPDTITFAAALSGQSILLGGSELEITETITITGPGPGAPGLTIDARQSSRVLNFSSTSGDLTLEGLTVTGGQSAASGGGIRFNSSGALMLTSSTVSGNSTTGDFARGGGIYTSSGNVSLTSSTVSGNITTGTFAYGGGIYTNSGSVSLTSSTVSGNSGTGSYARGGGIFTYFGSVSLASSTVSGNSTTGSFARGGAFLLIEVVCP